MLPPTDPGILNLWADVITERDHILGISYSPRLYYAHISIWTKSGDNRQSIECLQRTAVSRLSEGLRPTTEMDYYYKKHSDHEGWREAVVASMKNEVVEEEGKENTPP